MSPHTTLSSATQAQQNVTINEQIKTFENVNGYDDIFDWKPLAFKDLPKWLQDNEFLLKGHRPALPNFRVCFQSIFRIHTETGNIWTHMLACFFILLLWQPLTYRFSLRDQIALGTWYLGAIMCLGFSFVFHTLACHSPEISNFFSKLDYGGIAILTTVSSSTMIYYGFNCRPHLQMMYLTGLIVNAASIIYMSMDKQFSSTEWRPTRAVVFTLFGAEGVAPVLHFYLIEDWSIGPIQEAIFYMGLMGLLYVIGAVFYAFRIPERFFPGKFDIWLNSHQILHICVIAAVLSDLYALMQLSAYKMANPHC